MAWNLETDRTLGFGFYLFIFGGSVVNWYIMKFVF